VDNLTVAQRQAASSIAIRIRITANHWYTGDPSGRGAAFKDIFPGATKVKIIDKTLHRLPHAWKRGMLMEPLVQQEESMRKEAVTAWFQAGGQDDVALDWVY
jgi:hypothetical protein